MACENNSEWNQCGENSPQNETLPSALQNFITAFFGTVTKTSDASGQVTWVLPCNLDSGIPGWPRIAGEGLACYFARILGSQIEGLAGQNAYGTCSTGYSQPAIGSTVQVAMDNVTPYGVGQYVWVQGGGFYTVSAVDTVHLLLTLENPYGPPFNVSAGVGVPGPVKILPSGAPEASGPQGPQGAQGEQGETGENGTPGVSAYGVTSAAFIQPNVGASVIVSVASTAPFQASEYVWIPAGVFYQISSINSNALTITLVNLYANQTPLSEGQPTNVLPGTQIPSGAQISPSGPQGIQGVQGEQPEQFWTFNQAGTNYWVCPSTVSEVVIRVYGGGGGGGGGASTANGGAAGYGGGGGEYADATIAVTAGTAYSVIVGAGGAGGSNAGDSTAGGTAGGATAFQNGATLLLQADGGGAGGAAVGGAVGSGGTGGAGTATNRFTGLNAYGAQGGPCGRDGAGGLQGSAGANPGGGGGAGAGGASPQGGFAGGAGRVIIEVVPA